ncbi:MAG: CHAP domain-containing protein [Actinobacteria bacterium]|nr:CHAP domain-containing protein [Actinomycetota bacterium]
MNRKIIIIILLLVLSLFFMYPGTIKADTAQTINEQIVNETYKYTDNEPAGSCVEFVKNILRGVGIKIGAGYRSAYLNAIPAPTEVSMNDAKAGDVIQISNDTDETHFHNGMHAAIIFGSGNSNGYFDVVDSNWDRYPERDKDGNILKDKDGNIIWHDENRVKKSANQPANLNNQTKPLNFIDKIKTSVLGLFNEVKGGLSNFGKIIGNLFVAKAAEPSNSQSATIAASQESQQGIQASTKSAETAAENTAQIPQPSKPSLTSPYNWYQSIGESPALRWQGDSNSASYYVLVNSSNTGNIESGWINSTSWKPNLPNENYIYTWKVKAKNSQGIEGPWSDESHFSTASTNLKFEGDISFSPPSPSSSDKIKIFASTTGWGGVGVTLRVSVNTAPDGSTSGMGKWNI